MNQQYSLFLIFFLFLSGSAIANTMKGTQGILEEYKEYNDSVATACDSIATILKTIEGLHVTQADGIVKDYLTGTETIGCLADVENTITKVDTSEFPHDFLRKEMEANTWREDISRAGDGPSSSTYSLYRDEVMCTIFASWVFASESETSKASEGTYTIEVRCMKNPANKSP